MLHSMHPNLLTIPGDQPTECVRPVCVHSDSVPRGSVSADPCLSPPLTHLLGVLRPCVKDVELRLQTCHGKLVHLDVLPVERQPTDPVAHVGLPPDLEHQTQGREHSLTWVCVIWFRAITTVLTCTESCNDIRWILPICTCTADSEGS